MKHTQFARNFKKNSAKINIFCKKKYTIFIIFSTVRQMTDSDVYIPENRVLGNETQNSGFWNIPNPPLGVTPKQVHYSICRLFINR